MVLEFVELVMDGWHCDTVCLFSNETKDDGINLKRIEIIKFRKKFLKEYVLAIVCAKSQP